MSGERVTGLRDRPSTSVLSNGRPPVARTCSRITPRASRFARVHRPLPLATFAVRLSQEAGPVSARGARRVDLHFIRFCEASDNAAGSNRAPFAALSAGDMSSVLYYKASSIRFSSESRAHLAAPYRSLSGPPTVALVVLFLGGNNGETR